MATARVTEYQLEDCGVDGVQYFPGVGVSNTDWDSVFVGVGEGPREAIEDAIDQACASLAADCALLQEADVSDWDADPDAHEDCHLECDHGEGEDCPDHEDCELAHYAAVYVGVSG